MFKKISAFALLWLVAMQTNAQWTTTDTVVIHTTPDTFLFINQA